MVPAEDARLQEDSTGDDLSDLVDDASQLCHLDRYFADLLLRVRGPAMGHRETGCKMYGMRCQMPRKMQGPSQRRLSTT